VVPLCVRMIVLRAKLETRAADYDHLASVLRNYLKTVIKL
jgi:hypothetical protein